MMHIQFACDPSSKPHNLTCPTFLVGGVIVILRAITFVVLVRIGVSTFVVSRTPTFKLKLPYFLKPNFEKLFLKNFLGLLTINILSSLVHSSSVASESESTTTFSFVFLTFETSSFATKANGPTFIFSHFIFIWL